MGGPAAGWAGSEWAPDKATALHTKVEPPRRSVVVASSDDGLREALSAELRMLRWTVREARGAAEVFALVEEQPPAAALLDSWLPDVDVRECVRELASRFAQLDILALDGSDLGAPAPKGALRSELLHALRQAQERMDGAAWDGSLSEREAIRRHDAAASSAVVQRMTRDIVPAHPLAEAVTAHTSSRAQAFEALPEFVGADPCMLEVSHRIRLVAHRKTPVLVHGPTGTGKELVARALHRLSGRPEERFVAINCAAIPENLVEAELFGHARGAFTGAVQGRPGRIEAAAGGTLFFDEIGELPLQVQGKLLRFLESGEVQRVGDNEITHVDARVVAATHRKLGAMAVEGSFRLDLLHRLSVFLVQTPALAGRTADIDALLDRSLEKLGREEPAKQLSAEAKDRLHSYNWPGNVRELEHTVERAWILSGNSSLITEDCVDFGEALF